MELSYLADVPAWGGMSSERRGAMWKQPTRSGMLAGVNDLVRRRSVRDLALDGDPIPPSGPAN